MENAVMGNNNGGSKDIFSWGSGWFDSLFNAGMNIANAVAQNKWNKQQQKNWDTQFEYTKWLNDMMMQREDTAVQRAAADYQAAGFNRLLAAGQPAQAGTLTSFTGNTGGSAVQMGDIKNPLEAFLEAKMMDRQIQLTESQKNYVDEQAASESNRRDLMDAQKLFNKAKTIQTKADAVKTVKEIDALMYNLELAENSGTKLNENVRSNNLYQLLEKVVYMLFEKFGIDIYKFDFISGIEKNMEKNRGKTSGRLNQTDIDKQFQELMKLYGGIN